MNFTKFRHLIGEKLTVFFQCSVLIFLLALFINYIWSFDYNQNWFDVGGYAEGPIMDQLLRMMNFENIYHNDLSIFPYTIANYPPVYHLVQMPFMWIFGATNYYGFFISHFSIVFTALFIGLTLYSLTKDKYAAWVGGLSLILFQESLIVYNVFRPDGLALCLSWAGLFWVVQFVTKDLSKKHLFFAALTLVMAAYTKQTYVFLAPTVSILFLYINGRKKDAGIFFILISSIGLGVCAILNFVTDGGFLLNVVTANVNSIDFANFLSLLVKFILFVPLLLVLVIQLFKVNSFCERNLLFVGMYLFGAFVVSFLALKSTSSHNYFFELFCALSLVCGFVFTRMNCNNSNKIFYSVIIIFHIIFYSSFSNYWKFSSQYKNSATSRKLTTDIQRISDVITQSEGNVLADRYMFVLPSLEKKIVFQPYEFTQMQKNNVWDQEPFLKTIRNKEYDSIILSKHKIALDRWYTKEMISEINNNYNLAEELLLVYIFLPKAN